MISVVGSINWDRVLRVPHLPLPGETVAGTELLEGLGGKGANQAVAAKRAGGQVTFFASVGDDEAGHSATQILKQEGIILELYTSRLPTGTALIGVNADGQNSIMIYPGANADLSLTSVSLERLGRFVLLQLELSKETWQHAVRLAKQKGSVVVVNASPLSSDVTLEDFAGVDVLIVNEVEAGQLLGGSRATNAPQALEYARRLQRVCPAVVITLGAEGAIWAQDKQTGVSQGYPVNVVDTTGAGDAFAGALVVALSEGHAIADGVRFANAAGALATLSAGAGTSAARREDILAFLAERGAHA
jgi:ribokinase